MMYRSQSQLYSITSSARSRRGRSNRDAKRLGGIEVDRQSYLLGACTGRSAGFSPKSVKPVIFPVGRA